MAKTLLAPEPKTIVQCPSCQAKYALDSGAVSAIPNPRFHCSRCDNVFEMQAQTGLPPAKHLKLSKQAAAPTPEPEVNSSVEDFDFEEFSGAEDSAESMHYEPTPEPTTENPAPVSTTFAPTPASPPRWSLTDAPQPSTINQPPPPVARAEASARTLNIPRKFQSGLVSAPHEAQDKKPSFQTSFSFDRPRTNAAELPQEQPLREPVAPRSKISLPKLRPARNGHSPWLNLMGFASPILVLLAIMAGLSFYLISHPQTAAKLSLAIFKGLPRTAPDGLLVEKVNFKPITLDNGDMVYLISGQVVNNSEETLRDVKVEGLAFDKHGNLIEKLLTHSGTTLGKTRVQSLSTEMINNLQSAKVSKLGPLQPGQKQDFAIALMNPDVSKANYFSARIYSVRGI